MEQYRAHHPARREDSHPAQHRSRRTAWRVRRHHGKNAAAGGRARAGAGGHAALPCRAVRAALPDRRRGDGKRSRARSRRTHGARAVLDRAGSVAQRRQACPRPQSRGGVRVRGRTCDFDDPRRRDRVCARLAGEARHRHEAHARTRRRRGRQAAGRIDSRQRHHPAGHRARLNRQSEKVRTFPRFPSPAAAPGPGAPAAPA